MQELSVIIPVFNDLSAIKKTVGALRKQTYLKNKYEIIIIDNGSTDGTYEWLSKQKDLTLLKEINYKGSPYSARNRGIEVAKSEIIALLDSTCVPCENWVEEGLKYFKENLCDLFSGDVKFNFENKITAAKIYDSVTNVQVKDSVINRKVSQTANLWVKRTLFNSQGLFFEGVRSGEDIGWTSRAVANGYIIGFAEEVIVYKYARKLKELLDKKIRVGKGKVFIWYKNDVINSKFFRSFRRVLPIKPSTFNTIMKRYENGSVSNMMKVKIYIVSYVDGLATLYGNIIEYARLRKDIKKWK